MKDYFIFGEMAERSNAAVLKTVEQQCSGGSNPSSSASSGWAHGEGGRFRAFLSATFPVGFPLSGEA